MQLSMLWALGREGFGIEPARPLRILIIQAENDDHDMFDAMDGVRQGLGLSRDEWMRASGNIRVCHENSRSGPDFFAQVVRPLLAEFRPDLFFIDPAFGYLGGETNNQGHVSAFLRNCLNPLITEFDCGVIVNHHTNKPPTGEEKAGWSDAQMAYAGAGSAEWANWSRAVLALRGTKSYGVFDLVAAKRGERLRWREADGATLTFRKRIRHSRQDGVICWHEMTAEEIAEEEATQMTRTSDTPPGISDEAVLELLPEDGSVLKQAFRDAMRTRFDIGLHRADNIAKRLVAEGRMFEWRVPQPRTQPAVHFAKTPQP
ncbi:MAG: hypothetical protein QOE70_6371 [Chthoniobacter sp.]|nr:hypothetical protein [Chthoniobacter sp.]